MEIPKTTPRGEHHEVDPEGDSREAKSELLVLLRLLLREPPPDHDFKTCPICKRYGITEL